MRKIKKTIAFIFLHLFDNLTAYFHKSIYNPVLKDQKSICFVKVDGIGDCLIMLEKFSDVYDYYKNHGYEISLICAKPCKELYINLWKFETVYEIDLKKLYNYKYRKAVVRELYKYRFNTLINCVYSRTFSIDSLISVIRADEKIGNWGDYINTPKLIRFFTDKYYDRLAPPQNYFSSEISHNAAFFSWITGECKSDNVLGNDCKRKSRSNFFVVFPGAGKVNRCWEVEKYEELCLRLAKLKKLDIVICGGNSEKEIANKLFEYLVQNEILVKNEVGKRSPVETAEIVKQSQFVISNDTSGIHFANLYGIPNVCISKGCDIGRFVNPKDEKGNQIFRNHKVVFHDKKCKNRYISKCINRKSILPCISEITVDEVLNAVLSLE